MNQPDLAVQYRQEAINIVAAYNVLSGVMETARDADLVGTARRVLRNAKDYAEEVVVAASDVLNVVSRGTGDMLGWIDGKEQSALRSMAEVFAPPISYAYKSSNMDNVFVGNSDNFFSKNSDSISSGIVNYDRGYNRGFFGWL